MREYVGLKRRSCRRRLLKLAEDGWHMCARVCISVVEVELRFERSNERNISDTE